MPRISGLLLLVVCCRWAGAAEPAQRLTEIGFNRDVRPILSDNCFACHGPDAASRKAKLRLDQRESALERGAIVPGQIDDSLLVERILSDDADFMMPPPAAHKKLSSRQKQVLQQWVAEGAKYEPHWAFIPVAKAVAVPQPPDAGHWVRNPLDAFVLDRLSALGWVPAAEASREKWLRRVTFDLTGLPPSLEEIDAFLADESPGAYERVVDRLLAAPAYGERMANDWLDAARYADTFGFQADRDMHVWPWRDWLIRAFNDNLGYDKFITWQTAGDLLDHPTRDQYLATAFNRLHRQTNEGGSIEEEFRVAYVADRVQTNGTVFLGLTFECAKCHDHKYDPIRQADFYRFSAFFNNIDEHGLYSHFTETAPTPALLLYAGDQEARHRDLLDRRQAQETELARLRTEARARFDAAADPAPVELPAPVVRFTFDDAKPGGENHLVPGKSGQALEFGGDDAFPCPGAGEFKRSTPFSFALWVKPAAHRDREIVLHRCVAAEDAAFRGLSLVLDQGHVVFSLIHFWPGNAIRVRSNAVLPVGEWTHLAATYDGSSRAAGVQIYVNGAAAELQVERDRLTRDFTYRPEWGDSGKPDLALGARFRDSGFRGGAVDELVVFDRALTPLEAALAGGFELPAAPDARFAHHLARHDAAYQTALDELRKLQNAENDLVSQVPQIMVMVERPDRRPTFLLKRGAYDAPGDAVLPGTPTAIPPVLADLPPNRLGLARWMIDDQNPLTSRVAVNRLWQLFYGRGLVITTEDFGSQGSPPSHPQLLDWLARRFMDSGWNVKEMCRLIVLSATYRQASVPADPRSVAEDPDNRQLAHGPRHRLSAEQIRDNALAVSGLLDRRIGGPSVRPYQPAGLWEESGTGKSYVQSHGADLYRRSLYTFWRRTSPPPGMMSFDATSREVCTARREPTNTPLQALVLLNDPQFVEAARVLAERLIKQHSEAEARLNAAFRLLTSRAPTPVELAILQRLHHDQRERFAKSPDAAKALLATGESARDDALDPADHAALSVVVVMLMSFDECVTKR